MPTQTAHSHLARFLWVRLLALVFFAAFLSAFVQLPGLCGSHGLLPAQHMIQEATRLLPETWKRVWIFPSFCWISASDFSIRFQCILGLSASAAVLVGLAPGLLMAACWALYLSVAQAGQEFYHWPFDDLLLECGLLAALVAPWRSTWFQPDPAKEVPPSSWEKALALTVLFKCFFLPGLGHLTLGDPAWPTLTAFSLQFWTQPLPTSFGLSLSRFPLPLLKTLMVLVWVLEVGAALLLPCPPRIRRFAFYPLAILALGSAWSGDSIWTGALLLSLCLWTLPDEAFPVKVQERFLKPSTPELPPPSKTRTTRILLRGIYTGILGITSLGFFFGLLGYQPLGKIGVWVYRAVYPSRSFNSYLPTEPLPTHRVALVVEGTAAGTVWKEYGFFTKQDDPSITPASGRFILRRLDARVAASTKSDCQDSPFLAQLCSELLYQNTDVLALLASNPFPTNPPACIRIQKYEYRLANAKERKETGACWIRDCLGDFCPEIRLPK